MDSRREGNIVFVKLSDGDDLFPSLEASARQHGLENGVVAWGIGMLRDFELGFFGPHGYEKTVFSDRHELLALHGSISMGSEPTLHLHVALGRPDNAAIGGHLFGAKTAVVNEIQMTRFDGIRFHRRLNEKTGLRELVFG
jgi:predicted DNA-binding protein with PD1-like motif